MTKTLPLLSFIFVFLTSFIFIEGKTKKIGEFSNPIQPNLIVGNWVLCTISAKDSIDVIPASGLSVPISSNGTIKITTERVSLLDYISRQLKPGITKFLFSADNSFQFYRKESLAHSGKWTLNNETLVLEFSSGEKINTQSNKIISVDSTELVLESESHGKPITLHFNRQ